MGPGIWQDFDYGAAHELQSATFVVAVTCVQKTHMMKMLRREAAATTIKPGSAPRPCHG